MSISAEYLAAGNPSTSADGLRRLCFHDNTKVRRQLAENPNTPQDVLRALSWDKDPEVRASLASNSAVPPDTIEALCRDRDLNVRLLLSEGLHLPERILKLLAGDSNPYVRDRAEWTRSVKTMELQLRGEAFNREPGEQAKIGELMMNAGFFDQQRLNEMMRLAASERRPLGHVLLRETALPGWIVVRALKLQATIRQGQVSIADAVKLLSEALPNPPVRPLKNHGHALTLASPDITGYGAATGAVSTRKILKSNRQPLQSIIDLAQDAFIILDRQGRVVEWSTAAENTFGWLRQDIIGRLLTETVIPAEYAPDLRTRIATVS